MDIIKVEDGCMTCVLTIEDPSQVLGVHCTKVYPLIHYSKSFQHEKLLKFSDDKKTKGEGFILPLDLGVFLKKPPYRTFPANDGSKFCFIAFNSLAQYKKRIEKVECCSYNNRVVLYEEGCHTVWILNDQAKFIPVHTDQFLTEECFQLKMHVAFSLTDVLVYLKNQIDGMAKVYKKINNC